MRSRAPIRAASWLPGLLLLALFGCSGADTRPVLYPNATYHAMGKAASEADIDYCIQLAADYGHATDSGKNVAASTAKGAAVGAAVGGIEEDTQVVAGKAVVDLHPAGTVVDVELHPRAGDAARPLVESSLIDAVIEELRAAGFRLVARDEGLLEPQDGFSPLTAEQMTAMADGLAAGFDRAPLDRTGSLDGAITAADGKSTPSKPLPPYFDATDKKVAIVGGGPAGLAAARLAPRWPWLAKSSPVKLPTYPFWMLEAGTPVSCRASATAVRKLFSSVISNSHALFPGRML